MSTAERGNGPGPTERAWLERQLSEAWRRAYVEGIRVGVPQADARDRADLVRDSLQRTLHREG